MSVLNIMVVDSQINSGKNKQCNNVENCLTCPICQALFNFLNNLFLHSFLHTLLYFSTSFAASSLSSSVKVISLNGDFSPSSPSLLSGGSVKLARQSQMGRRLLTCQTQKAVAKRTTLAIFRLFVVRLIPRQSQVYN